MLEGNSKLEVFEARNTTMSLWRYLQSLWRLIILRLKHNPDVYILAFRGFEIYWPVRLLTLGKPLIFDEFINVHDWMVYEHKKIKENSIVAKSIKLYMRCVINASQKILADTKLHAESSSETYDTPINKYQAVYVGTDEKLFYPRNKIKKTKDEFTVFFYGNLLPLHGLEYILLSAAELQELPIKFQIIGGANRKKNMKVFKKRVESLKLQNVEHYSWVDYNELPQWIAKADLCLGGPFGNTPQSRKVITGKTFQFLAMEKPAIIGVIDEQVGFVDKYNCLIVRQGSRKSLTDAIRWAYDNRSQLNQIANRGYSLYHSEFSNEVQSDELVKTIKKIA